jgi:SAM-dependent methyltransferase
MKKYLVKKFYFILEKIIPSNIIGYLRIIKNTFGKKIQNYVSYLDTTANRNGLEIGGPSDIFKYKIPVYNNCKSLEFVNFSALTVWEGNLSVNTKYYKEKIGKQHIYEATELPFLDQQFDFVLSCNCLEHVANPIKALKEWKRVSKFNIILLVPRKENSFDHKRQTTSFDHLINDFNNNTNEDDLTHLEEILSLHDLKLDPQAGSFENFKQRSLNNFENRCLHHHVFDGDLVKKICDYLNMKIISTAETKSDWIFLIETNHS